MTPFICLDENRPGVPPAVSQTVKSQFVRSANTDPAMLPEQPEAESVYHSCNLWDLFRRIYSLRTGLLKRVIPQGPQPSVGYHTHRFFDPQCYENRGFSAAYSKDPEEKAYLARSWVPTTIAVELFQEDSDIHRAALFCFAQSGQNRLVRLETVLNA